jgi:Rad3-related DNA helicase
MATAADAQALMQFYDLRRESEMRKARSWFGAEFNPQSFDEFMAVVMNMGSDGNRYFRMITSYWEMGATMVLHGAFNEELFLETQPEIFFVFAKVSPFLQQFREKLNSPEAMKKTETLLNKSEAAKKRLQETVKRIEQFRAMAAAASQKN